MTITALPTPPLRSDPTNFAARADAFLAAIPAFATEVNETAAAMNLNSTTDISASSVLIGLGAKTFTVTAGKSFQKGMFLVVADSAAPSTNSMVGQVTSYSGTSLVISVVLVKGSGTKASWVISQSVPYATSIDGVPIGSTTPSAGNFTNISTLPTTVFEAGRYIDFHGTNSTNDFDVRFDSGPTPGAAGAGAATLVCGSLAITGAVISPVLLTESTSAPSVTSRSTAPLSTTVGSCNLLESTQSNGSSFIQSNTWIVRNSGAEGWPSVTIHEGIAVDSSFLVPGSTTLAWSERATNGSHKWGNGGQMFAHLDANGLRLTSDLTALKVSTTSGDVRVGNGGNSVDNGGSVLFAINDAIFGGPMPPMSSIAGVLANAAVNGELQGGISFRTRPVGLAGQVLTERMRLDHAGNLGLGVVPSAWEVNRKFIEFGGAAGGGIASQYGIYCATNTYQDGASWKYKSNAPAELYGQNSLGSGGHQWYIAPSGTAGQPISFNQAMTLDAGGNLLVGTTFGNNPLNGLTLSNSPGFGVSQVAHPTGTAAGSAYSYFLYNGSPIGSITQSGTTAVLYNTTSDARLKENITDASDAASLIDALQVRQFDWKTDGSHQRYGFVAQELYEVAPEAVSKPQDPEEMMAVDYSKLVPMLVKEIQSLRQRLANAGI